MEKAGKGKKRLGEMLLEEGLVSEHQLAVALGQHRQWGGKLGEELVARGFITEEDLCAALERQLGIPWLSLRDIAITPEAVKSIKAETAKKYVIMPVAIDAATCTVAIADPKDLELLDTLNFITGKRVKPVIATHSDIRWAIEKYYEGRVEARLSQKPAAQRMAAPAEAAAPMSLLEMKLESAREKETVRALLSLLLEKGIITEEEFMNRLTGR